MTTPVVSVVVATHRRAALLPRLLAALEDQDLGRPFEVLVVDDASPDDTPEVLAKLVANASLPLRVLRLERNAGPATARNVGWRQAAAPLVAFTDDDCVPRPGWLSALVAGLDEVDVVQGRTRPNPEQLANTGPFSRTLDVSWEEGFYQTCNIGYRAALLERLGGFDEAFRWPAGEDTDLAWRALELGATTRFVEAAEVWHDVRPSSFVAHVRDLPRWSAVVHATKKHPGLRDRFTWGFVWKRSHPPALAALVGAALVVAPGAGRWARLLGGAALTLPYLRHRAVVAPLQGGPRRRLAAIPLALAADVAEVGILARASARHRTLVL
ncbi:MAG: glycosyl transferase family 2 [Acidimicrobiales bacterium]|nr:glycosyl transferase family 2 [Acidimicrobiales bacterium]